MAIVLQERFKHGSDLALLAFSNMRRDRRHYAIAECAILRPPLLGGATGHAVRLRARRGKAMKSGEKARNSRGDPCGMCCNVSVVQRCTRHESVAAKWVWLCLQRGVAVIRYGYRQGRAENR